MNKDQLINNNQYNVVGGRMLIFLKMDLKYSKKKIYKYYKGFIANYFYKEKR